MPYRARAPSACRTIIVAVNFAKCAQKRPKLSAKNIRERDGIAANTRAVCCTRTKALDHVVPRSRVAWTRGESVWSAKDVNQRKADRLLHEAGLVAQRSGAEGTAGDSALRNAHGVARSGGCSTINPRGAGGKLALPWAVRLAE